VTVLTTSRGFIERGRGFRESAPATRIVPEREARGVAARLSTSRNVAFMVRSAPIAPSRAGAESGEALAEDSAAE
jgi:hypothetical protein